MTINRTHFDITRAVSRLTRGLAAGIMMLAVNGCSDNTESDQIVTGEETAGELVQAGFFITVGDSSAGGVYTGRAPEGNYDPGEGWENQIDLPGRDFRFLIFSGETDGSQSVYQADFEVTSVLVAASTASSKTYHVLGKVDKSLITSPDRFRIMVLANWGEYPEVKAGDNVDRVAASASAVYTFDDSRSKPGTGNLVPLYGIQRMEAVSFDALDFANLGTIHLIRAFAKIDVRMDESNTRWSILSAAVTRCNTRGYAMPLGVYDREDYVKDNYNDDYTSSPSIPASSAESDTPVRFFRVTADSTVYRAYVPEFVNIDADGNPRPETERMRIDVRFTDRRTGWESFLGDHYIEFKYYIAPDGNPSAAGRHFNVMRNYWYRYTIRKDAEIGDMNVTVDVQPYAEQELAPGFGLERDPVNGYIVLKKSRDGTPTFYYDELNNLYYDAEINRLTSNYAANIQPFDTTGTHCGIDGELWIIKRANGMQDQIGSADARPSLFYNADTGIYYDYNLLPLNCIYATDIDPVADTWIPFNVDFTFNDILLAIGSDGNPTAYYNFANGHFYGAINEENVTTGGSLEASRAEIQRYYNGWVAIIPYWTIYRNSPRLYYNIYTRHYYDKDGYCLGATLSMSNYHTAPNTDYDEDIEFYASIKSPQIFLITEPDADGHLVPTLTYNRVDGEYYQYTDYENQISQVTLSNGNTVMQPDLTKGAQKINRPARLKQDSRLEWPPRPTPAI